MIFTMVLTLHIDKRFTTW